MRIPLISVFYVSLMLLGIAGFGQTLSHSVIGSTGSIKSTLTYTVGETVIQTGKTGTIILAQGFHQPDNPVGTATDPFLGKFSYKLYPNPVQEELILDVEPQQPVQLRVEITDIRGRRVMNPKEWELSANMRTTFDVSTYATGVYTLTLYLESGKGAKSFRFRKVD